MLCYNYFKDNNKLLNYISLAIIIIMIIVTSDSSCDLHPEQLKKYNIQTVPLYVNLNGEEFRDGVNITPFDIFEFVKENKKLPKTSALSVASTLPEATSSSV